MKRPISFTLLWWQRIVPHWTQSERLEDHTESLRQSRSEGRLARGVIDAEEDDGGSRIARSSIFHLQFSSLADAVRQYILKRLLLMIPTLFGVAALDFFSPARSAGRHRRTQICRYRCLCAERGARARAGATGSRSAYLETVHQLDCRYPPPGLRHIHVDGTADYPRDRYST